MGNPYSTFEHASGGAVTPWKQGFLHRQVPFIWNAAAVDTLLLRMASSFFLLAERPHFRGLPAGWEATGGVYTTPELIQNPGLFFRPVADPVDGVRVQRLRALEDGDHSTLSFVSPYKTYNRAYQAEFDGFKGNETFHGRLWRHRGGPQPTVICVHGWMGGFLQLEEHLFAARTLYDSGLNVALITMPFHGTRKPKGSFAFNLFPSSDLRRTNEGLGQAIADIQVLMRWLRAEGIAERIGVIGFSLGGYVSALLASLDASLDFVVPVIAPSSLADLLWNAGLDATGRHLADAAGFDLEQFRAALAVHCPLSHTLQVPKERVLLVGGRADRVVPNEQVLALWRHWQEPELIWYPGGHYVHFGRQDYISRIQALIGKPKAGATPASSATGFAPLRWLRRWVSR